MDPKQPRRNYFFGMEQVRRFVPAAKISALLLTLTSGAVACIYGLSPLVPVSHTVFQLIVLIWSWNVCIFACCGGMVLWGWLVDRYGDPPDENGRTP